MSNERASPGGSAERHWLGFKLPWHWPVVILIVVLCGIEAVLQLADAGLLATTRLRGIVYHYGAFWPGLLSGGWSANYTGQPWLMFLTYGVLHGGLAHLVVNIITLWSLGGAVLERVGVRSFALVYLGAQVGGGIAFGLLSKPVPPMVGASGALFGLVGALLAWNYVDRYIYRERLWPVAQAAGGLVLLNLILWWAMSGQLAWETHLGGFIAGWLMATLVDPRARDVVPLDTDSAD